MAWGLNSSATSRACEPLLAVRTSKPTKRRLVEIKSLMLDSSSTTRMRWLLLSPLLMTASLKFQDFKISPGATQRGLREGSLGHLRIT